MSIQKKSLINTLKSAKKANVVKEEVTVSSATVSPVRVNARPVVARAPHKAARTTSKRGVSAARKPVSNRFVQ